MDSPKPRRDSLAKLKLLGGMLRLGAFSARELAVHANVNGETARAFAEDRCKDGTVEKIGSARRAIGPAAKRGGRPENIYQLKPEHRQRILQDIVQIRRSVELAEPLPPSAAGGNETAEEDFSPLALLEAVLAWLAADDFEDVDDRLQRLDQARIRLAGAEADFQAMMLARYPANAVERFAVRLTRAREGLAFESARQLPSVESHPLVSTESADSSVTAMFAAVGDDRIVDCSAVMRFLVDWSASVQFVASEDAPQTFAWIAAGDHTEDTAYFVRSVLHPIDARMREVAVWSQSDRQAFGRKVIDGLMAPVPWQDAPLRLTKLAISAALVGAADAAEPLVFGLLQPGMMESLGAHGRELCSLALARLARPSGSPATDRAAAACLYLLNRDGDDDTNVPILAPAALRLASANEKNLLNLIAGTLYERMGLAPRWRSRINEGAMLRNLAWVLQANRYSALSQHLPDLVERDYGAALLKALIKRSNGALNLVDRNGDKPFKVNAGATLANQAGLMDEQVPLGFSKEVNDKLGDIYTEANWDEQGSPDQRPDAFTSLLGGANRPALQLIQGGRP
jgi:hypothetical protein